MQRTWHRVARFDPPPGRGGFACLGDSRIAAGQSKLALVVAGKHVAFIRRIAVDRERLTAEHAGLKAWHAPENHAGSEFFRRGNRSMRRRVVAVEAENGIVERYGGSAAVFTDMKQSKLKKSGSE